jgi:hypothetical protein
MTNKKENFDNASFYEGGRYVYRYNDNGYEITVDTGKIVDKRKLSLVERIKDRIQKIINLTK